MLERNEMENERIALENVYMYIPIFIWKIFENVYFVFLKMLSNQKSEEILQKFKNIKKFKKNEIV